ncbi:hypothetical protein MTQ01_20550 [Streptomyces sp. XM4193]|uniref:hypothetical protein n=1 Tax=Streptomyces sp. XM4193 TaxID=2929782 RepID=UPI001FF7347C|nr:hypothetical protein [Streptomyces sp. XM4193]MCK1798372.1 hypothetical protein [Streptomyces sp. XM4193]
MTEEWWQRFARERLGGREVPSDLRALGTARQQSGRHPLEEYGITLLEPDAQHPLTDVSYLTEQDRANADIMANCAAFEQMAPYVSVVAVDDNSGCIGYWHHPDQSPGAPTPIVMVDSEGSYRTLAGRSFVEACLDEIAYDDDETYLSLASELAALGISVPGSSTEDLELLTPDPDPEEVHHRFYTAERSRRGLPV